MGQEPGRGQDHWALAWEGSGAWDGIGASEEQGSRRGRGLGGAGVGRGLKVSAYEGNTGGSLGVGDRSMEGTARHRKGRG